jgi:hypothetical protein
MKFSTQIETEEDLLDIEVDFDYNPIGFSDNSYECAPEIEINGITCDGLELDLNFFTDSELYKIENEALEFVLDYEEDFE